jgi:hypothetical protein
MPGAKRDERGVTLGLSRLLALEDAIKICCRVLVLLDRVGALADCNF